jgi:hypothetical protein
LKCELEKNKIFLLEKVSCLQQHWMCSGRVKGAAVFVHALKAFRDTDVQLHSWSSEFCRFSM